MALETFDEMKTSFIKGIPLDHLLIAVFFLRFADGVTIPIQLLVMHHPYFLISEMCRVLISEAGYGNGETIINGLDGSAISQKLKLQRRAVHLEKLVFRHPTITIGQHA